VLLLPDDRAVWIDDTRDSAAIAFKSDKFVLPAKPLTLAPQAMHLLVGQRIGWMGYPGLAQATLCLFTGTVSAWLDEPEEYLIDGVAIHGVSGGPAFFLQKD